MFKCEDFVFNKLTGSIGKIIEVKKFPNGFGYRVKPVECGLSRYPFNPDAYYPDNILLPFPLKFLVGGNGGSTWEIFILNHPKYLGFFCFAVATHGQLVETKNHGVNCHLFGSFISVKQAEIVALKAVLPLLENQLKEN